MRVGVDDEVLFTVLIAAESGCLEEKTRKRDGRGVGSKCYAWNHHGELRRASLKIGQQDCMGSCFCQKVYFKKEIWRGASDGLGVVNWTKKDLSNAAM